MKIVYNPTQFGLQLTETEMKMFAQANGWTLRGIRDGSKSHLALNSTNTWFKEIDWLDFRSHPMLIKMVETGALTNKNLCVVDAPAGWEFDTDWETFEKILTQEEYLQRYCDDVLDEV